MTVSLSPMLVTDINQKRVKYFAPAHEVAPGVLMHAAFSNTYALKTGAGVLLIDPGLAQYSAQVYEAIREWSDQPLGSVVFSHGHVDHICGLRAFEKAGEKIPLIIAQENLPARIERYQKMHGWNATINHIQFSTPQPAFPRKFTPPTLTFRDSLTQKMGDLTIHLRAAKAETDDMCYVWVPEERYLFCGDLFEWTMPNCGNPQKVQRYPLEWAEALEEMAGLGAEWLFPGHGFALKGEETIRTLFTDIASFLRHLVEQVIARMNAGQMPEDILHGVEPDPDLASRPYLRAFYDHPKFIVRNLLRLYGGWWNGNPADLLPATWETQAQEIALLAGGVEQIVQRGHSLLQEGKSDLAAHLAEWATRAEPANRAAQELKRDVYLRRIKEQKSLMARGIYIHAMNQARRALGEEPLPPKHRLTLGGSE